MEMLGERKIASESGGISDKPCCVGSNVCSKGDSHAK